MPDRVVPPELIPAGLLVRARLLGLTLLTVVTTVEPGATTVLVGHGHRGGVHPVIGKGVRAAGEVQVVRTIATVLVEPSPQAITTVCVSSVPGSVKVPDRLMLLPSLMVAGVLVRANAPGGTLTPKAVNDGLVLPPSLSVTVTVHRSKAIVGIGVAGEVQHIGGEAHRDGRAVAPGDDDRVRVECAGSVKVPERTRLPPS